MPKNAAVRRLAAALVVILGLALMTPLPLRAQQIWINEVQVSNGNTLTDENADSPDWIELFNPGPSTVNLNGWGLSDATNSPFKWTFTNASLASNAFLLVFASGKDRQPGQYGAVDPATVTGLRVWLHADQIDGNDPEQVRSGAGGVFLRSWRDRSGGGFHAGQGTDANQPQLVALPALGGRTAVHFDGTNDALYLPAPPALNNFTIIAVAWPSAGHEIDAAGSAGVGGVSGQRYLFGAQHGGDFNSGAGR
jgi:Lamin Tail Domain